MRLPLVLDWDGTVTETDTLHMVIERYGDLTVFHAMEAEIGRRMTLREVIAREMATISAPLDEVVAWLVEHVHVRAGFDELVATHDPLVVSAGFHELISPILAREGVTVRVVANTLEPDPAGWRTVFAPSVPCDVCGEECKRAAVAHLPQFAYVGDGVSDRCVALAAERVFARAGLARYLDRARRPVHAVRRSPRHPGLDRGPDGGRDRKRGDVDFIVCLFADGFVEVTGTRCPWLPSPLEGAPPADRVDAAELGIVLAGEPADVADDVALVVDVVQVRQ